MLTSLLCFFAGVVVGGFTVAWVGNYARGSRMWKRRSRRDHFEDAILDLADPEPAPRPTPEGYLH